MNLGTVAEIANTMSLDTKFQRKKCSIGLLSAVMMQMAWRDSPVFVLPSVYMGVVAALIFGPFVQISQAQSHVPITTTYEVVKTDLTVHEPVFLRFVAESVLSFPVVLDLGMNSCEYFEARITKPDGNVENMPSEAGLIAKMGITRKVSLLPHTPYTQLLLLNRWFDFDAPGRYTVELTLSAPVVTDTGTQLQYAATKQTVVDIQHRDPDKLQRICNELAEKAISAPMLEASTEATQTLSFINDPIAVEPLARVAKSNRMVELFAINGLRRIGSDPAADALISLLDSSLETTRDRARGDLWFIADRTKNGRLRDRIMKRLNGP